jgi:ATP-dependent RNA helicase HelY
VLVAAPTGSGKTVVGEHAVALALAAGGKAFYTAPIKALSNQKYSDLVEVLGEHRVGLLTGDHAIRPDAPVVVMTTEVLRNMVYAHASTLEGLEWVVLDEVHFLQDTYRGPVWEEVLIHTPPETGFVCLSATVSNAAELGEWVEALRGPTTTVVEHRRPVELDPLYLVGDRSSDRDHLLPVLVDGRPNPEGSRFDAEGPNRDRSRRPPHARRRRFNTPRRLPVIERLDDEDLLPCIYFIFSRAACDDAAAHCLDAGVRLTDAAERTRVRAIAEARTAHLADADLDVLGHDRWLAALEQGIAPHHAGMVPAFRETVEECFVEGLVKVVFATETLALGINMPARSVVIERLTKFNGDHHEFLTPAQFTQLTGRAGRRGIDERGAAVVLWSPFVGFGQVAALAGSREYPLASAFRPTYNMAANLVGRYDRALAESVLARSFAQFQADRAVVRLRSRAERVREELASLDPVGDGSGPTPPELDTYAGLAERVRSLRRHRPGGRAAVEAALSRLTPGDVVERRTEQGRRLLLVVSVAYRKGGAVRVRAVTAQGEQVDLTVANAGGPVETVTHIDLPVPYAPDDRSWRRDAAAALRRTNVRRSGRQQRRRRQETPSAEEDAYSAALAALEEHPLHQRRDRDELLAAHRRRARLAEELADIERRTSHRDSDLVRRFDRVLAVLDRHDHLNGWSLTSSGERLRRIYHESDLLIADAAADGVLDDLDPAEVAAVASCFTYEHRSSDAPPAPVFPTAEVRRRFQRLERLADRLQRDERAERLPETRSPDPGFVSVAHAWASGGALEVVLDDDLTGGDFVRNVKQLVDLLRQLVDVVDRADTSRACRAAADALLRGVVVAGGGPA